MISTMFIATIMQCHSLPQPCSTHQFQRLIFIYNPYPFWLKAIFAGSRKLNHLNASTTASPEGNMSISGIPAYGGYPTGGYGSQPTSYAQPMQSYAQPMSYAQPTTSYAAPVQQYAQPVQQTYVQPQVQYQQPVQQVQYQQPIQQVQYQQPVQQMSYAQPTTSYAAPTSYAQPAMSYGTQPIGGYGCKKLSF